MIYNTYTFPKNMLGNTDSYHFECILYSKCVILHPGGVIQQLPKVQDATFDLELLITTSASQPVFKVTAASRQQHLSSYGT